MLRQKMSQRHEELLRVLAIAAPQCVADIILQHVADLLGAVVPGQQILRKCGCRDCRDVFVLGDGQDLSLGEAAHRDAVFERDHVRFSASKRILYDQQRVDSFDRRQSGRGPAEAWFCSLPTNSATTGAWLEADEPIRPAWPTSSSRSASLCTSIILKRP